MGGILIFARSDQHRESCCLRIKKHFSCGGEHFIFIEFLDNVYQFYFVAKILVFFGDSIIEVSQNFANAIPLLLQRDNQSIAVALGLWIGGKKPVVLIQNTGLFESGDSVRGLALDMDIPIVLMIGYRGWTRHGVTNDSAAHYTEPILNAWGIEYYLVESDEDIERISICFEEVEKTQRPVACLFGAEWRPG